MRSRLAGLLAALVTLATLFLSTPARAQSARPELHFHADGDVVGLGDVLHVTLQAMSSGNMPSDPQIGSSAGFALLGMSPSTSTQMSIVNGTISSQRGLTTVWTLRATKLGTFTLGPPTVNVDGTRYSAHALSVRVVSAGQAPQRQQPQQQNPFDPFGGIFGPGGGFGQLQIPGFDEPQQRQQEQLPPIDQHLALDSARAPTAFLHAVIDKPSAVVGEQVTYTVYIYIDTGIGHDLDINDPHEAPASDFQKRSLQADDTKVTMVGYTMVGGKLYGVQLLRKSALFPLKTGDLDIGEMAIQMNISGGGVRRSEDLHVHVSEPPVQGRPPGYAMGDVGQFSLSADVSGTKDVEQDGAIGVTVTLSGTGNLPSSLTPPEHAGVEWLDPQMNEKLGPQVNEKLDPHKVGEGDRFGGTRTFQYVVRMHKAGDIDLGDFTLPFWNPRSGAYEIASAHLGTVHVKAGTTPEAPAESVTDPLPNLPAVRTARETIAAPRRHLDDTPGFWLGLGAMPLAYAFAVAAAGTAKRVRETRAARGASPHTELKGRVKAAEDAAAAGGARAIDAATARAIDAATIAECRVNVRGLTTSDVARTLVDAGVAESDAGELEAILRACEAARFSASGAQDDGETAAARERWTRARTAIERLAGRS